MFPRLIPCLLFVGLLFSFHLARAQCTFTTIASGNWTNPAIWSRSGCSGTTTPQGNEIVNIGHAVILNRNVTMTTSKLTISATGGSLVEDATPRTLTLQGDNGNQQNTTVLEARGKLEISTLNIDEVIASFYAPATVKLRLSQTNNATLNINSLLTVLGNVNLQQGNVTAEGNGYFDIKGCLIAVPGSTNGYIVPPLQACVRSPGTGSGPCSNYTPLNNSTNCQAITALPVEFVYFRAKPSGEANQVVLEWATASETNNASFTVERALDGRQFIAVSSVPGQGSVSSVVTYSVFDTPPSEGMYYYRLKQTDYDGSVHYTHIVAVQVGQKEDEKPSLEVFPMPSADGMVSLQCKGAGNFAQLWITSTLGKVIYQNTLLKEESTVEIHFAFPPAAKGVYVVHFQTARGSVNKKILVH